MTVNRAESQYGRRRSNTAQSVFASKPHQPLKFGDTKIFNSWVHDPRESANVIFNHSFWPGVAEGDILRITVVNTQVEESGFLFTVPKDEGCPKPQLQISIPKPIAETCSLRNNGEVAVTKVDKAQCSADYVEFTFQDQYLGRNDMWRLAESMIGQCVYVDQDILFLSSIAAKIQTIYIAGKQVSSACMTSTTKAIHRSLSAKVTIFIQVCKELWQFAGDGERYTEKVVHSFLPELFARWRDAGTNHTVTIVLISRVHYSQDEVDYAAGPLLQDDDGNWYKDFYKVITDLEVLAEWRSTLVSLKTSFWAFQRDILLTHHYHRSALDPEAAGPAEQVRLVGRISFAHDGPILEAINLALNPTETHYIDRSLSVTGVATLLITPGTGYFRVSKQLLRLTTTRMLDQGFGLDLISLAKPPLHQSPIFSFQGVEPELKTGDGKFGSRAADYLWGGDDDPNDPINREKTTFWWEPFWISISFWDKQMDLPFRADRFVARAKMHEIQMLGLLEHDVLSTIEVPFLKKNENPFASVFAPQTSEDDEEPPSTAISKVEAEKFDNDIFVLKTETTAVSRNSYASSSSGTIMASSSYRADRSTPDKRTFASHRSSVISNRITPIEESPRMIIKNLPDTTGANSFVTPPSSASVTMSSSPSQSESSIRSAHSKRSKGHSRDHSSTRSTLSAKLTPSWFFNPFKTGHSEPQTQTSAISAMGTPSASSSSSGTSPIRTAHAASSRARSTQTAQKTAISRPPRPMAIKNAPGRSTPNRAFDDEIITPGRGQINISPSDDITFTTSAKRRRSSTMTSIAGTIMSVSSPNVRINPLRPQSSVPHVQSALARRWEHMFPRLITKHEIKWKSIVIPGCLPLTTQYFPSTSELDVTYDVHSWDFIVDLLEMKSFLVKQPNMPASSTIEEMRQAWALVIMRGMVAVRLAQGFQFVLKDTKHELENISTLRNSFRRSQSFMSDTEHSSPKPSGAADVLRSTLDPVYLSMSNEIHRISYFGEYIRVSRYVRRMPPNPVFEYKCLIWPKRGVGYTELTTSFRSHGLENFGWNRLDMLVAGYEHQFNESLHYWRTRFIVIPSGEVDGDVPLENLNEEETRLLGMEKLAEQFTKLRWNPPGTLLPQAVRFLPTTFTPVASVMDETLMAQLDDIHAVGPLKKKMKSERTISDMSLAQIAKAMREEDGVPIKANRWHGTVYHSSFTGFDFISWLVREFQDVSSRTQGVEVGSNLVEAGLFEHCRGIHPLLDGHYYYRLKAPYASVTTPRGWFRSSRSDDLSMSMRHIPSTSSGLQSQVASPRKNKKRRLILSQSMVLDIDPAKRSDQAEAVVLHHDIIHNPATVFHFELQWIGTTARCIEDQLRQWSRMIERYGLRLVEAYVTQISDIRDRNAFQSCFPVKLALAPPIIPDLYKRLPDGKQSTQYFEYELLRKFDFILDVEAANLYPEHIDVVYSYRRSPYTYSQFVHRSGYAFVQVVGGSQGFLFLTNRLMGPGRMGAKSKDHRLASAAEDIRQRMWKFCQDKEKLAAFYEEQLAAIPLPIDEPPDLNI